MGKPRLAATMTKHKKDNVTGVQNHNEREHDNHSNKDIDLTKKHLNYTLSETKTLAKIIEYIEENKTSKRKTRKDAVLVNEWVISDMALQDENGDYVLNENGEKQYYLKGLPPERQKEYMQTCFNYFADEFGEENIAWSNVHRDETNIHMHLGVIPLRNGKLTSKQVFNQYTLKKIQSELPKVLQEAGFDIERGLEGNKRTKLSVKDYKETQDELKKMNKDKDKLYKMLDKVENRAFEVKAKENTLNKREEALNGRERRLNEREEAITAKFERINEDLRQKEEKQELKADFLHQKEKDLNRKQDNLQKLAEKVADEAVESLLQAKSKEIDEHNVKAKAYEILGRKLNKSYKSPENSTRQKGGKDFELF